MPAWVAVMAQVPIATSVTVEPETVQTGKVVETTLTGSPEEAVALRVTVPVTSVVAWSAGKVMV